MSRVSPSSHEMHLGLTQECRKGADAERFPSNQAVQ